MAALVIFPDNEAPFCDLLLTSTMLLMLLVAHHWYWWHSVIPRTQPDSSGSSLGILVKQGVILWVGVILRIGLVLPGNMESPGDGSESGDVETGSAASPTPDLVTVTVPGCRGAPFWGLGLS